MPTIAPHSRASWAARSPASGPEGRREPAQTASNDVYLPLAVTYPEHRQRDGSSWASTPSRTRRAPRRRASAIEAVTSRGSRRRLTIAQTGETGASVYAPVTLNINGAPAHGRPDDLGCPRRRDRRPGPPPARRRGPDRDLGRRRRPHRRGSTPRTTCRPRPRSSAAAGWYRVPAIDPHRPRAGDRVRRRRPRRSRCSRPACSRFASRRERDLQRRQADAELRAARESLLTRITEVIEREIEVKGRLRSLARTLVPAVGDVCTRPRGDCRRRRQTGGRGRSRRGDRGHGPRTSGAVRDEPDPRGRFQPRAGPLHAGRREPRGRSRPRARASPRPRATPRSSAQARFQAEQRSNMIVPLVARGRVLGTISLSILNSSGRDPLDRDDIAFGMEVATHAAMALDNARLYEQQRDIAAILQQALLPRSLPEVEGAEVAVRHRPGRTGTEVGGDFYDLFEAGDRWVAVVGDVCGKGPEAAALTALGAPHAARDRAAGAGRGGAQGPRGDPGLGGEHVLHARLRRAAPRTSDGLVARVTTAGHPEPRVVGPGGDDRKARGHRAAGRRASRPGLRGAGGATCPRDRPSSCARTAFPRRAGTARSSATSGSSGSWRSLGPLGARGDAPPPRGRGRRLRRGQAARRSGPVRASRGRRDELLRPPAG